MSAKPSTRSCRRFRAKRPPTGSRNVSKIKEDPKENRAKLSWKLSQNASKMKQDPKKSLHGSEAKIFKK
jgi:hypothetical protein